MFNDYKETTPFDSIIPPYPLTIYDYYKINRVLSAGVPVPDLQQWNSDVSEMLKTLGPKKHANVVIVFANTNDPAYIHALESRWLGGKKNDTVIAIGTLKYPRIDFVRVFSWSKNKVLEVELRDELQALKEINRPAMMGIINKQIAMHFEKLSMEEFKYLEDDIIPPTWLLVVCVIVSFLLSGAISFVMYHNDEKVY